MAYFRKYTLTSYDGGPLYDNHPIRPSKWRVDISDDQGNDTLIPYNLLAGANFLELERIDTSDDKNINIIGEQATITYIYTGNQNDPLPGVFFDQDERRFKVEVYQDDNIRGVYYVKPDSGRYPYQHAPYEITLTATDGLAFLKTTDLNVWTDGLIDYRWMSLYEIMMTRGIFQVTEGPIDIHVFNTLEPENASGESFLNDTYVHIEMFYDFNNGPDSVYTMLEKICKQFNLRLFLSNNRIEIHRLADNYNLYDGESYENGNYAVLNANILPRTIGSDINGSDAIPLNLMGTVLMFPAIKKVSYDVLYRSINLLKNFQYYFWDGNTFADWVRFNNDASRVGSGTNSDPFKLRLKYTGNIPPYDNSWMYQDGTLNTAMKIEIGDVVEFSVPVEFNNVNKIQFNIVAIDLISPSPTGINISLDNGGEWVITSGDYGSMIEITRSGKNKFSNVNIRSKPFPSRIGDTILPNVTYWVILRIFSPLDKIDPVIDPDTNYYADLSAIKLGIAKVSARGKNIIDIQNGRFSKENDKEDLFFIDTGIDSLANTIAINNSGTPSESWHAQGGEPRNSEVIATDTNLQQYARSVYGMDATLYSNNINFWNVFSIEGLPNRKFVMTKDRYIVRECTHECSLQEILPETTAETTITYTDITE